MPVVGDHSTPFLIAQGSAATYLPVEKSAWGIVALRGQVGTIQGTSQFQVPPDQRFYAGGSGTVRGYTYQTIGPLFADDNPEGGQAMDAFSIELRQHITKTIGIVPFIDAGQVNAGSTPFTGKLRVGAGLGARYYTGIGPIRVDLAFPLKRVAGSGSFALYIGLGEAF
ncbi:MAG: BamA/TamA family outer membrane protein, partial [Acidocella sp.]|nr:BamA/TamA family outer membrane protein [Acidocella sp.]